MGFNISKSALHFMPRKFGFSPCSVKNCSPRYNILLNCDYMQKIDRIQLENAMSIFAVEHLRDTDVDQRSCLLTP